MVWHEPKDHLEDCYFCMHTIKAKKSKNKSAIKHPSLPSAIRPIGHSDDITAPLNPKRLEVLSDSPSSQNESSEYEDNGLLNCLIKINSMIM